MSSGKEVEIMKAIIAFALAAALFAYALPAMAETGQEGLNAEMTATGFVPAPRAGQVAGIAATVHNLDESRPDVRD
jgi:hypothetical protein